MPRPYRPNPIPKACPPGKDKAEHAKERRAAHPKQETAAERKERKRFEAELRNGERS